MLTLDKFNELRRKLGNTVVLGFPLKLLIAALTGIFGGAGVLAYLSDYATYYYAISVGVRPPLEGVPYLSAAIALGTVLILSSSAAIFTLCFFAFRLLFIQIHMAFQMRDMLDQKLAEKPIKPFREKYAEFRQRPLRVRVIWSIFCGIVLFIFLFIFRALNLVSGVLIWLDNLGLAGVAAFSIGFITALVFFIPKSVWFISGTFTFGYVMLAISFMFQPFEYAKFLRFVGYGGGLPIMLQSKDATLQATLLKTNVSLILRTNDTMIVLDTKTRRFLEIPRSEIVHFSYKSGGLHSGPPNLPPRVFD